MKNKNIMKLTLLMALGIIAMIYFAFLINKMLGNPPVSTPPARSSSQEEIKSANNTVATLLGGNSYGFVMQYTEKKRHLQIKADGLLWKEVSVADKKSFLMQIAGARATLGLMPVIKVVEARSGVELASFEKGRATLGDLDF